MWFRKSRQVKPTQEDVVIAEVHFWRLRLIYELNLREWPDSIELNVDTSRTGSRKFVKTRAYRLTEVERTKDHWQPVGGYALSDENVIFELQPVDRRGTGSNDVVLPYDLWEHEVAQDARDIIRMIQATIKQVRALPVSA